MRPVSSSPYKCLIALFISSTLKAFTAFRFDVNESVITILDSNVLVGVDAFEINVDRTILWSIHDVFRIGTKIISFEIFVKTLSATMEVSLLSEIKSWGSAVILQGKVENR